MATPDSISAFDRNHPLFGAYLNADVVRRNLREIRRNQRGTSRPRTAGQCYADNSTLISGSTLNLATLYNIKIALNGAAAVTIDLRTGGASPAGARTLADIVAAINTAMGATIAYAIDNYLWLVSTTVGSASTIQVLTAATLDATDLVFAFLARGLTYPVTFTGTEPEDGMLHEDSTSASDFNSRIDHYLKTAAHVEGVGVTYPINLSERWNLKLTIDGASAVTVDCRTGGASAASVRTLADIVTGINAAMGATVAFAVGGQLRVMSTTLGTSSSVAISEPTANDAAKLLFGRVFGVWPSEVNRLPYTVTGRDWNQDFFRGVEETPGVGMWGRPVNSKTHLPATGHTPNEVRVPGLDRVPFMWDAVANAWVRAVPVSKDHLTYDTVRESYGTRYGMNLGDLQELEDTYVRYALVDSFTRANAGSLGGSWAQSQGKFTIVSNKAVFLGSAIGAPPADEDYCRYTGGTPPTNNDMDVWASLSMSTDNNSTEAWAGLLFRSSGAASYYSVRVSNRRNGALYWWNGASNVQITTFTLPTPLGRTAQVLRVRIVGTLIKVYWGGSSHTIVGNDVQPPTATPGGALVVSSPNDLNITRWEQDEEVFLVLSITDTNITTGTRGGLYGKPSAVADVQAVNWGYREIVTVAQHERGFESVSGRRQRHTITSTRVVRTVTGGENVDVPATWAHMPMGTYIQDCRPDEFRTAPTDQALIFFEGPGIKLTGFPAKNAIEIECTITAPCFNEDQCATVMMLPPGYDWGDVGPPPGYNPLCFTPVATNFMIDPAWFGEVAPGFYGIQPTYPAIHAAMVAWAASIYTEMSWPAPDQWQGVDLLYAMLTKLIGQQPQTPQPQPGFPTFPTFPISGEDVPAAINPGLMYAPNSLTTPLYWIKPVAAAANLPTVTNGGFVSPQVPPAGVRCHVIAEDVDYVYNGTGTDTWSPVKSLVASVTGALRIHQTGVGTVLGGTLVSVVTFGVVIPGTYFVVIEWIGDITSGGTKTNRERFTSKLTTGFSLAVAEAPVADTTYRWYAVQAVP